MGSIKKEKTVRYIWYAIIFAFMFIWFSKVHPLVPFDGDDWGHLSFARRAVPELTQWNPAKLFPEIFMSVTCTIAAFTIAPITGDYIGAITIMSAFVTSGFITVYIHCFSECLKRIFKVSSNHSILIEALFLILHFLIFRQGDSDNTYLLYCIDLNCYYNYLLPALLNASLVLFMIKNDKMDALQNNGLFYVAIYFAIFSNLVDSIILTVYAGSMLICNFVKQAKCKFNWKKCMKSNRIYFLIIVFWGISAVFELSGGRAALAAADTTPFLEKILAVLKGTVVVFSWMHKMFILLAGALVLGAFALWIAEKEKKELEDSFLKQVLFWGLMIFVTIIYTVVICAKVSVGNIYRSEYLFALFFFVLVALMFCLAYILRKKPKAVVLLPLGLCILSTYINTNLHTFKESNYLNVSGKLCMQMSKDLVNEMIEADKAGKTDIELKVSLSGQDANWPQSYAMGDSMAITLYKHGIVSRMLDVTIVPSEEYNNRYQIYQ